MFKQNSNYLVTLCLINYFLQYVIIQIHRTYTQYVMILILLCAKLFCLAMLDNFNMLMPLSFHIRLFLLQNIIWGMYVSL